MLIKGRLSRVDLTNQESSYKRARPLRKTTGFEGTEQVPPGLGRGPEPVMTTKPWSTLV